MILSHWGFDVRPTSYARRPLVSTTNPWPVMSSCLCKKVEGAVFALWVHPVKDCINDSIHTLHVAKADHGPSATPHLDEAALDDVGDAQLLP